MNVNVIDPEDPVHLDQLANACQIAPLLYVFTRAIENIADGQEPIKIDHEFYLNAAEWWAQCPAKYEYVEQTLLAIRAAIRVTPPGTVLQFPMGHA